MNTKTREYIYCLMTDRVNGFKASVFQFLLYLASLLYLLAIKIIFSLHHHGILPTFRLDAKVISIGNLTWGGTGKTPLVEMVVRYISGANKKVTVLSRGYKLPYNQDKIRDHKLSLSEEIGDEAALLRLNMPHIPVLVGVDRVRSGVLAIRNHGADFLVLDDGFQYWRLSRDIDILTIDATNPFGNGMLLPRGILREPISDLARANMIVITKVNTATAQQVEDIKNIVKRFNPDAVIALAIHKPVRLIEFASPENLHSIRMDGKELPLDLLKGKEIAVICGIGDPVYFLKTIENMGGIVKIKFIYEDHSAYSFQDLAGICYSAQSAGVDTILTTDKDMIKLKPLISRHASDFDDFQFRFLALGVQLEIVENRDRFIENLTFNKNLAI